MLCKVKNIVLVTIPKDFIKVIPEVDEENSLKVVEVGEVDKCFFGWRKVDSKFQFKVDALNLLMLGTFSNTPEHNTRASYQVPEINKILHYTETSENKPKIDYAAGIRTMKLTIDGRINEKFVTESSFDLSSEELDPADKKIRSK